MELKSEERLYKIGEAAEILDVHIQTLRIYDKENLLPSKRSDTNRRCYTDEDIERAKLILYLTRALSVNLNGVKIILHFIKKSRIAPELAVEFIKNAAKTAGITEDEIANNLKRYNKEDSSVFKSL